MHIYVYIYIYKGKEGEKNLPGESNGLLKEVTCSKRNERKLLKRNIPRLNQQITQITEPKPHTKPSSAPPYLTRGLCCSQDVGQAAPASCLQQADNTKITRAVISIIHACLGAPRLKADSCGAHSLMP